MKRVYVYIAAPYTLGDVIRNVCAAISAADELALAGLFPYIPHLSHFWHFFSPHDYTFWMSQGAAWLEKCDYLLRLPGKSNGADVEETMARVIGIPVYYSVAELIETQSRLAAIDAQREKP